MEEFLKLKSADTNFKFDIKTSSTGVKYYVFGTYSNTYGYVLKNIEPDILTSMQNELSPIFGELTNDQLACIYYIFIGSSCNIEQLVVLMRIKQFTVINQTIKTVIISIMNNLSDVENPKLASKASKALKISYIPKQKTVIYTKPKPKVNKPKPEPEPVTDWASIL